MSNILEEYQEELKKVLLTRDPDKLVELSNEWAPKLDNERMAEFKDQPRDLVELVMHQMIAGISGIPNDIRAESEKWLEEYHRNNQPDTTQADEAYQKLFEEVSHLIQTADEYPHLDSSEIPDARHFAVLPGPGAPRICFTKQDVNGDGNWFYHLSISSSEGDVDDTSAQFILMAFDPPETVTEEIPEEPSGKDIRHFCWPCGNSESVN